MAMWFYKKYKPSQGFTLIEVLLALAVIAISLTALLKTSAENIRNTARIKDKTISQWVAMQGIAAAQLGLIDLSQKEVTEVTKIAGQRWYWRIQHGPSSIPHVEKLVIRLSKHQQGPFRDPLIGYRYSP